MKKTILALLATLAMVPAMAATPIEPVGDDLFPWPHGIECPIALPSIEGYWMMQSVQPSWVTSTYLIFELLGEHAGVKYLKIYHADYWGVFAEGTGYAEADGLTVRGVLNAGHMNYVVLVRSYSTYETNTCHDLNRVTSVTFCNPADCDQEPSHLMVKIQ